MGRMERGRKVLLWRSRVDVMRWIGGRRGGMGSMSVTEPVKKEEGGERRLVMRQI